MQHHLKDGTAADGEQLAGHEQFGHPALTGAVGVTRSGPVVAALTALRKRQLEKSTIAGAAYRTGLAELDWYQGGEYLITDEAGTPAHPEWYSDEFGRLLRRAGLRRITLHDSRHTTLTLMEHAGVPISIISKCAGHYDSAFTQKTYVHASEEDLQRGQAALAKIHKIA